MAKINTRATSGLDARDLALLMLLLNEVGNEDENEDEAHRLELDVEMLRCPRGLRRRQTVFARRDWVQLDANIVI